MKGTKSLQQRQVTPDDVIAWLQADYRLRAGFDPEVDGGERIDNATTIAEWRSACDLIGTSRLVAVMNEWFGCTLSLADWRSMPEPEHVRTLGELAGRVAPHMRLADFSPITIGGQEDRASGAFFALRAILATQADPIPDLRPSTPLSSLAKRQVASLGFSLARLAPNLTPEPKIIPHSRQHIGGLVAIAGILMLIVTSAVKWSFLLWAVLGAIVLGVALTRGRPKRVLFGSFQTVGDVARAVARTRLDRPPAA